MANPLWRVSFLKSRTVSLVSALVVGLSAVVVVVAAACDPKFVGFV